MSSATDDTRNRLLEAAGEIFAAKGFQAATVREISQKAGANLAAINYHFGDKMQLYIQAVEHAHCRRFDEPPPTWPEGTPPSVKLRGFLTSMLGSLLDDERPAWHAQLMMRELAEPTEACVRLVEAYIRPMADVLGKIVGELRDQGKSPLDLRLACFSVVGQCLFYRFHQPIARLLVGEEVYRDYTVERLADHITKFTLSALGIEDQASISPTVRTADPTDVEE